VIQNNKAKLPYVAFNADENVTLSDNKTNVTFDGVDAAALTGDVRITDTVNGKDMVFPAVALTYPTAGDKGLVYLEGEKANIADVDINTTKNYNIPALEAATASLGAKKAYITYGDAPVNNMYALITSPFKRVIVSQDVETNGVKSLKNKYFTGVKVDKDTGAVTDWGSYSLTASIYDTNENKMSAGQFSPATTPTLIMKKEVATTGYDATDSTKLPFYLTQAADKGYTKGYVVLQNANSKVKYIPGYITQMIATTAGGKVVTNWIVPATK
jgi:hypothetical protein